MNWSDRDTTEGLEQDRPLPASGVDIPQQLLALGPAAVSRIVDAYIDNLQGTVEAMRQALHRQQRSDLETAAHSLKGSSGVLRATRVAELCRRLEALALDGSIEDCESMVQALDHERQQIEPSLRAHLDQNQHGSSRTGDPA